MKHFLTRSNWTWTDYTAALTVIGFLLTVIIPSSAFIRPISYKVQNGTVEFHRETPFGTVWATWDSTILRLDGSNLECSASGFTDYQTDPRDFVTYQLSDAMRECVDGGPPFRVKTKLRVWAGYSWLPISIPLRPSSHTFLIK